MIIIFEIFNKKNLKVLLADFQNFEMFKDFQNFEIFIKS